MEIDVFTAVHPVLICDEPQMHELSLAWLQHLIDAVKVKPSLLHGDLWSGNMSPVEGGGWSILDPAVYYVSPCSCAPVPGKSSLSFIPYLYILLLYLRLSTDKAQCLRLRPKCLV